MQKVLFSFLSCALFFTACKTADPATKSPVTAAPVQFFSDADAVKSNLNCAGKVFPTQYRLLSVNYAALRQFLVRQGPTPGELSTDTLVLAIPKPDGTNENFVISQIRVLATELAAKFPEIKTYSGKSKVHPTSTIRVDISPQGFRAMVQSEAGALLVDPWCRNDTIHVISYYRKYLPENTKEDFEK